VTVSRASGLVRKARSQQEGRFQHGVRIEAEILRLAFARRTVKNGPGTVLIEPLPPSPSRLPGYLRAAARITYAQSRIKPEVLWFDVPEAYREDVSQTGDSALLALLPLAFRTGEPLRLAAPVDPFLLQNARAIQKVWSEWTPSLKPVPIEAGPRASSGNDGAGRTGLFFSGGVDSFFSALHWDEVTCASGAPDLRRLDDLIFVWGFDIPLKHRRAFERKRERLAEVARELGKNLVIVVTNLRETRLRSQDWGTVVHGPALGAAGLVLGKRFSRLLISSAFQRTFTDPWGSHPDVDPLMSTGNTAFLHYGDAFDRFEKTAFVARSELALRHLHVCWREGTDLNCGACEKCYRTLLTLELLGVRHRAMSFPQDRFSLERVASIPLRSAVAVWLMTEVRDRARQCRREDVADAIDRCLANQSVADRKQNRSRWQRILLALREGIRKRLLLRPEP
jgi:hypothetical protein